MIDTMEEYIDKKLFYDQNGIIVRQTIFADVEFFKHNLRHADIEEIWASHHHFPQDALMAGFEESELCLTVEDNGIPVAMFGVNSQSLLSNEGIIWFLATPHLKKIQIRFLRHCKFFIRLMLSYHPYLYNWVDQRNKESILWLKFCGATIEEAKPFGAEQMPFHYFYFKK